MATVSQTSSSTWPLRRPPSPFSSILSISLLAALFILLQPLPTSAISGGEEILLESSFDGLSVGGGPAQPQTTTVFQIPDQQAYLGKLFYYKIQPPAGLHDLRLVQAGHHLNPQSRPLPEWLHFNRKTGELFGAPLEKKIYFIQVAAQVEDDHRDGGRGQSLKTYEDIFVIEVLDAPAYLAPSSQQQGQQQSADSVQLYQCRIELKHPLDRIEDLYQTIARLRGPETLQLRSPASHPLAEWLNRFSITAGPTPSSWKISYEVERCGVNIGPGHHHPKDHIYLDQNSEQLLARLSELRIESELVKISSPSLLNMQLFDLDQHPKSSEIADQVPAGPKDRSASSHAHRRSGHRRRNAYADDPDAYATPTLKADWKTLTTSTIDLTNADVQVLSRTLIPSMISPTFSGVLEVAATPSFGAVGSGGQPSEPLRPHQPMYPHLYSTPVLMPDMSSLITRSLERVDEVLATPVMPVASTSMLLEVTSPVLTASSVLPTEPDANLTTTPLPPTTTDGTPAPTIKPNHRPFVNRRIAKLSITAGKYWQYTIPETTFLDLEDGNTRALRLAFFKDSELPPIEYWIQFDHENQYLYALPTEDNIGKYRFNLVAIDSAGAEVTETLEIYVRQPRESLTYTHKFIMSNVTWDGNLFVERIQAVSTLLQRMATQIFEEVSSTDPNEAVQKQTILHSISVLSIAPYPGSEHAWIITWSNDSLRRTPCPIDQINALFSKLYDITHPEDGDGYMTPSNELRQALTPEFSCTKIKREFIGRSACGGFATPGPDFATNRLKNKIVFSNRLNRLGPYKIGAPFRFQIPKDTVYSVNRQADARDLVLSLAPVEPNDSIPDWIFFDVREQTIYGLPYQQAHVQTLELQLLAEDPITGGREKDIFGIDVVLDGNTREDYLMEVTMSFAIKNVEKLAGSELKLTAKDYYQVAQLIATRLMANSNLDAIRMLEINRHRFTKMDDLMGDPAYTNLHDEDNNHIDQPIDPLSSKPYKYHHESGQKPKRAIIASKRRRSYHHLRFKRSISGNIHGPDYFYEFIWTNRTLVTSYLHSANAFGGGTVFETETCPKETISRDIYDRLFPSSAGEFAAFVQLAQNVTSHLDVMEIYTRLFESIEANVEFLSVEWTPKSTCQFTSGLEARTFGAKPIKESESAEGGAPPDASPQTPAAPPTAEVPIQKEDDFMDTLPTQTYLGDKLLAMIIPPIAILTALLFAVGIGCCFHKANNRRKAMGNMQEITEENPNLYRQRIPIQFEFERGGGPGMRLGEQESMLDSKLGRHPIQIMPMKRGMGGVAGPPLPSHHGGRHQPGKGMLPGQHMTYQMLPQQ